VSGYEVVEDFVTGGEVGLPYGSHFAVCPSGKVALGGGYSSPLRNPDVVASKPSDVGGLTDRWLVEADFEEGSAVFVICALPAAATP
jgi:hypothetical protein